MLNQFITTLRHRLSLPLPGREAQLLMAHSGRKIHSISYKIPQDARWGSVLILFYEEDHKIKFPLILRATYDGVHSGQVGFPGGKFEPEDVNLFSTALREAEEEIGIERNDVAMLGSLTDLFIPPSNFLLHPQIGMIAYTPEFIPDPVEVVSVIEVPLDELMSELFVKEKEVTLSNGLTIVSPYYDLQGHHVWGATAMVLSELKTVIKELGEGW